MPQTTTMVQDTVRRPAERQVSRRMLLAGSAGLVGAAAVAARPALAQGSPPASVLPIQAPLVMSRHPFEARREIQKVSSDIW
jgi:hypothetical protein